ncbi:MAG: hypothetical protein WBB93_15515, partial [Saprospiraceae bacterium]
MKIDLKNSLFIYSLYLIGYLLLGGCNSNNPDKQLADETQTTDWPAYGRTHNERRFSPLTAVDTNTVSALKVDW